MTPTLGTFKRKHGRKIRPMFVRKVEKFRDCGNLGFKIFVVKVAMMSEKFHIEVKVTFVHL
jgi:hypothetical protein